ncbi:MAG TPA: hypothetical protein DDZ51_09450 [Planctomycetaceae bacterium]|nr:hypothetical protein [Planctomycetaceae bacterium]
MSSGKALAKNSAWHDSNGDTGGRRAAHGPDTLLAFHRYRWRSPKSLCTRNFMRQSLFTSAIEGGARM